MKDHYTILGISRGASNESIKAAYRKAAKDHHPDLGGCREGSEAFLKAREAYEVLSDEKRRRVYDRQLERQEPSTRPVPPSQPPGQRTQSYSRFSSFLLDDLFGFSGIHAENLYLELELSPEEAASGGAFPLTLPVVEVCNRCRGAGFSGYSVCPLCLGQGRIERECRLSLAVPAGVYHGLETKVSLEGIGLPGHFLEVVIRIPRPMRP